MKTLITSLLAATLVVGCASTPKEPKSYAFAPAPIEASAEDKQVMALAMIDKSKHGYRHFSASMLVKIYDHRESPAIADFIIRESAYSRNDDANNRNHDMARYMQQAILGGYTDHFRAYYKNWQRGADTVNWFDRNFMIAALRHYALQPHSKGHALRSWSAKTLLYFHANGGCDTPTKRMGSLPFMTSCQPNTAEMEALQAEFMASALLSNADKFKVAATLGGIYWKLDALPEASKHYQSAVSLRASMPPNSKTLKELDDRLKALHAAGL